ncbi:MAG: hypothetical protein NVS1B3_15790 [Candidatus Dormibacteraceae bacterium]
MIATAVFAAHLPTFLYRLLDSDEAIYGSIAALMNSGEQLYAHGGVDNKPPGIFWVYALTFRGFGVYQMTAIHAVGFVAMAATCVLIFMIAFEIAGTRAGLLAALFYGLITAAGHPHLLALNTEILMMLPLTGSVLLCLRRRWFWAGLLLLIACAFRQSAAVNFVVAALAILWLEGQKMRAAALLAGGLATGLIAVLALTALTGSLTGLWRWSFEPLYGYAASNWTTGRVWSRARDSLLPFLWYGVVYWMAAIASAVRWNRLKARERVMVVWLVAGMAGALAGSHLSWHYFIQAMGPLAVVAALAFDRVRLPRLVAVAAVAGIAIPVAASLTLDLGLDRLTFGTRDPVPQHAAVSAYVRSHTTSSDRIFVWGDAPELYVQSDRVMSSRFPGFLRGFERGSGRPPDNWDTTPDVWPLLRFDLNANPPALIVDTAPGGWSDFAMYPMSQYPVLAQLVATHYRVVAIVDSVVIYGRAEHTAGRGKPMPLATWCHEAVTIDRY